MACTVPGCSNRAGGLKENNAKISFHRFPADSELKNIWIKNVRKGDSWRSTQYTRICSEHFERSCFREGYERKVLHSHAVPTIFPKRPASCQPKKIPLKRKLVAKYDDAVPSTSSGRENQKKIPLKRKLVAKYDDAVPSTSSGRENQVHGTLPKISRRTQTENTDLATKKMDVELQRATKLAQHYKMIALRRGRKLKNTQRQCQRLQKKKTELEIIIQALYEKDRYEDIEILSDFI